MVNAVDQYIQTNLKDKPFIIMGHSMGGGIALVTYIKYHQQITEVILECPLTAAVFNQAGNHRNLEESKTILLAHLDEIKQYITK
jgi:pimeloyl-ACP methyl ester carboxylesterase